jgi:hypothetical protein
LGDQGGEREGVLHAAEHRGGLESVKPGVCGSVAPAP